MRVLKFGGSSVGSAASVLSVKKIVEQAAQEEQVIVVVSALGGITDRLLKTADLAFQGDSQYRKEFDDILERHEKMVQEIIPGGKERFALWAVVSQLLEELRSIYHGVYLIRDLSERTRSTIVSYGERISSNIVATLIEGAEWYDSREFIKTEFKAGKNRLATELTYSLVRQTWSQENTPRISVLGGFISTDADNGEVTNLGRGGSDYTAAIIAAALYARQLEIWTDVDGFMTADPRVISSAYVIPELSYVEAMELCNFGAKVIYPPTIYPVCIKNIPILIKNTFNPSAPGSVIKQSVARDAERSIKGISSIKGTTLITIAGLSMVGVIGVNRRIFGCLAQEGISVFMVSQASSESSTSLGVKDEDCERACQVLDKEFEKEIADGSMFPAQAESGLATVAVVGEHMKHTPGIAGKLFGTLGRSGISVIACAQGASETNISFVIQETFLRKALNVIHDSFFLSEYKVLNLFVCGVGTVGSSLLAQIAQQQAKLKEELRLDLRVVGIASGHNAMFNRSGLNLEHWQQDLKQAPASNNERLREEVIGMNIFNSVFVDCTASPHLPDLYEEMLTHNINVVAANKIAASGPYETYKRLKETAKARGVKFVFETNVGAGLPIIRTINDLVHTGDKVLRIEAVLSGTLNYIFNMLSAEVPFSQTVRMAQEMGFSEPDPRIDLSGKDVLRKLVILCREAGYKIEQEDVEQHLFVPQEVMKGTKEEFWEKLPSLDAKFEEMRAPLAALGKKWRYVAIMENGKASTGLKEIPLGHPFYELEGSNNVVMLTTDRYNKYPMLIQGYGAGANVTAAGVFSDILSLA